MIPEYERITWAEISPVVPKMFHVWSGGGEIKWVEECWQHFGEAGMTTNRTDVEMTAAYLRLVTLARVYEEFSGWAWDENPDSSLSELADELDIDPLVLGILAARALPDAFDDGVSTDELRDMALFACTRKLREPIFTCLCDAYGGDYQLFLRMAQTNIAYDTEEPAIVPSNTSARAFEFVQNGFDL